MGVCSLLHLYLDWRYRFPGAGSRSDPHSTVHSGAAAHPDLRLDHGHRHQPAGDRQGHSVPTSETGREGRTMKSKKNEPVRPEQKKAGMTVSAGAKSEKGRREENQDRMTRFQSPFGEVVLVADGMG